MTAMRFAVAMIGVFITTAQVKGAAPEYMAIFLGDVKVGHVVSVRSESRGRVASREKYLITMDRGGVTLKVSIDSKYVESADGKPVSFEQSSQLGPMAPMRKSGTVKGGQISVKSPGSPRAMLVPYPTGALMPEGALRLQRTHDLSEGTTFSYSAFNPDAVSGVKTDVTVGKRTSVPLVGQVASLTRLDIVQAIQGQKITSVAYVDDQWRVRKVETGMMGMVLKMVSCDRKFALSPNGQADMVNATSVVSPTPIADAREVTRGRFVLVPKDKSVKLDLPDTGSQTISAGANGAVVVTTAIGSAAAESTFTVSAEDRDKALAADDYIDIANPAVKAAANAISPDSAPAVRAKAIEGWVRNHISNKGLTVGYASASATLASKAGDCSEHAVLTAALCRAAGIPCRVLIGIAYVDSYAGAKDRFIGHAWNEAFLDGRWVCLDAALGADAARIALAAGGGDPAGFIAMANSLGSFKITEAQAE